PSHPHTPTPSNMKFVDEYRDAQLAQQYAKAIASITTRPWTIMEICGGQTHAIVKFGIDTLLPKDITLIHGPGCPVCVTSAERIDEAIALASLPHVIFCSFGDMLRVPGTVRSHEVSPTDLLSVKAHGGDVRIVYSPLDALKIAQKNPDKEVVFFAVGFETTAPATAMAVYQAYQQGLKNFSLLVSHVLVPPAMEAILSSPSCQVQGFLAAGHVCTVMGYTEYEAIATKYGVPIVVTGFEPVDVLQGIYLCIQQLEKGQATVENQYARSVRRQGNEAAQSIIQEVFEVIPQQWRGIGEISQSGLGLRDKYAQFDVHRKGLISAIVTPQVNPSDCISGLILQGIRKPQDCPAFGTQCTPEHPLGAPMVSSEGACAAYYRYRQPLFKAQDIIPEHSSINERTNNLK
ncbi:MAG: hydrogenase formation protein HypD, partial [Scytonema sp. PMC 1070.18]|nr:hydrogenase formation protein HypD [Scytonema sp. PMC 1070.18]